MDLTILEKIGFEEKEAKAYVELLRHGTSPASRISEKLGYDRTTTYYMLLRMENKGYVSVIIQDNTRQFTATQPRKLLQRLKEHQAHFEQVLPEFEKINESTSSELRVETIRGKTAMDIILRELLETPDEWLAFGVDDQDWVDYDPIGIVRWLQQAPKYKRKERILTYEGAKILLSPTTEHRVLPKKYFDPTTTIVYENKVLFIIWEPEFTAIFIENSKLAGAFKKQFNLLWKDAKSSKGLEIIDVSKYLT